jgi:hypothetical protein
MLPGPATNAPRSKSYLFRTSPSRSLVSTSSTPHINLFPAPHGYRYPDRAYVRRLLTRSPLTNAGVFLLVGLLAISVFVNIRYWMSSSPADIRVVETGFDSTHTASEIQSVPLREGPVMDGLGSAKTPVLSNIPATPFPTYHHSQLEHLQSIARPEWAEKLDHLIIVPGHAIWKGVAFRT